MRQRSLPSAAFLLHRHLVDLDFDCNWHLTPILGRDLLHSLNL